MADKQRRRAENDFEKAVGKSKDPKGRTLIRRYFKFDYKATSRQHEQRVAAKIEVSAEGTNTRFVATKNRNNTTENIYRGTA